MFYIILQGEISVWDPRNLKEMINPIENLKEEVMKCINTGIQNTAPPFKFQFHLDPFI